MRPILQACVQLALFALSLIPFAKLASSAAVEGALPNPGLNRRWDGGHHKIAPKIMLIDMFPPEGEAWYGIPEFNVLEKNITVPGLSPLYKQVHCTKTHDVCQIVTGEAEINAASTIMALTFSSLFNFTKTYFFIAGIAGISPQEATIGSVTFARFAVQVGLQYEIDPREIPSNFSGVGYFPQGSDSPGEYPQSIYGTEVFELNDALRQQAMQFAKNAPLNDSSTAQAYRALYSPSAANQTNNATALTASEFNITNANYLPGSQPPSVVGCDVATADVYWSGTILADVFQQTVSLFTNGSGTYCTTAQEDNASLEALLRSSLHNLTDFSRIILMRTASDFDRPYANDDDGAFNDAAQYNLLYADQGGFEPAINNIYLAGVKVVEGILKGWNSTYEKGVMANNYIGDIFGSLGGTPDFGPGGNPFNNDPVKMRRRKR